MSNDTTARLGLSISYRRLDYWTTLGYLHPHQSHPGHGNRRHWPEEELAIAEAMGRMVKLGLTPEAAHRAARAGREVLVTWALG